MGKFSMIYGARSAGKSENVAVTLLKKYGRYDEYCDYLVNKYGPDSPEAMRVHSLDVLRVYTLTEQAQQEIRQNRARAQERRQADKRIREAVRSGRVLDLFTAAERKTIAAALANALGYWNDAVRDNLNAADVELCLELIAMIPVAQRLYDALPTEVKDNPAIRTLIGK